MMIGIPWAASMDTAELYGRADIGGSIAQEYACEGGEENPVG